MHHKLTGWQLLIVIVVVTLGAALVWLWLDRTFTATVSPTAEVDRSILTDEPCAPPCWQNVTPGSPISKEDVIQILETVPNVDHVWESEDWAINWVWKKWPWEGTGYNHIYYPLGVVASIKLSLAFELTVEEILGKYGEPEVTRAVVSGIHGEFVSMQLFYPTKGLMFSVMLSFQQPVLRPTSRVYEALYTIPADSAENWSASFGPGLQPWPGYGEVENVIDPADVDAHQTITPASTDGPAEITEPPKYLRVWPAPGGTVSLEEYNESLGKHSLLNEDIDVGVILGAPRDRGER